MRLTLPSPARVVLAVTAVVSFLAAVYACSSSSAPPLNFGLDAGTADAHEAATRGVPDSTVLVAPIILPSVANTPACTAAADGGTSSGCEYLVVFPHPDEVADGLCVAVFVVNASSSPVSLEVDQNGVEFDLSQSAVVPSGSGPSLTYSPLPSGTIPPTSVAIVFLGEAVPVAAAPGVGAIVPTSCPVPALTKFHGSVGGFVSGANTAPASQIAAAFHLTTSAPTTAYDMFPYGGAVSAVTSATLLLPTAVWNTNYVAVMPTASTFASSTFTTINTNLQIVALANDTHVSILPTVAVAAGPGVTGGPALKTELYTLQAGQILDLTEAATNTDLSGTIVQADMPIGVWGSTACYDSPISAVACDSAHQQIPPISALGHEYVAVRYRARIDGNDETVPWRVVGAVDGTTLTYSPAAPAGAPTMIASGQVVEFWDPGPFVVSSQDGAHPFYVSAHMTGAGYLSEEAGVGDPEFVNVIPVAEYLTSYSFFTDPTYPETNLVVVRATVGDAGATHGGASDGRVEASAVGEGGAGDGGVKDGGAGDGGGDGAASTVGGPDVILDCAGALSGWQPVDSTGRYEFTRIDLSRHDFVGQNGCNNGFHTMKSSAPFGLTVWGWGTNETTPPSTYVSYAYPAGASVQAINSVVVSTTPPASK